MAAILAAAGLGATSLPAATPALAAEASPVSVGELQVNGRDEPLGIPAQDLSFGWHTHSTARGVLQDAYQIRLATSEAALDSDAVWDSGKVESDRQSSIAYAGPALASGERYVWQVRVWSDGTSPSAWSEPSAFETGLLHSADWQGDWITAATTGPTWSDYTVSATFHLVEGAFGMYFRGADQKNTYMWQLTAGGSPSLRVHTKVNDGYSLLAEVNLPSAFTQSVLLTGDHTLSVQVAGDDITTRLDGTVVDERHDSTFATGYVGLRSSVGESFVVRSVEVTGSDSASLFAADLSGSNNPFAGGTPTADGLSLSGGQEAFYTPGGSLPLLRDAFATATGKTVSRARLYASALGVYDVSINGKAVGDQHLAPGSTNYDSHVQSQTYDVTDLLAGGSNVIGARLAPGWYSGRNAWLGTDRYGSGMAFIAQLRIEYSDGSSQDVVTDASWTTHAGPITSADNLDGESYDARQAVPGYDIPGFDASGWTPAVVRPDSQAYIDRLVPQPDEPVRTTQVLTARSRTTASSGASIYDMGQNMVGVARVTITGKAGETVTLRHAEVLDQHGDLWTANLRTAKATDRYTFATDGTITYQPTFTFHGFRYLEISGLSSPPSVDDVTGQVWESDLPVTGSLTTSDAMLNQLVSNISWGQRGNFLSIPTDTPARDERLGWMGDINVFAPTAAYLRDTRAFMDKFADDMRTEQYADGGVSPVVPSFRDCCSHDGQGGAAWEDAIVTVPYSVFVAYDDTQLVAENYDAMKRFLDHVEESAGADLIDSGRDIFGDWASLGPGTPGGVIGTAYFAEDARMLSEMAAALGKTGDAARYAQLSDDVRAAFVDAFVSEDGTVSTGTQTAYALALGMNMVPDSLREAVGEKYAAKLHADGDQLQTGFVGTPWLLPALTSTGQDDLAYSLLLKKTFPSWGYEISQGATTVWELWNSINPDGSFADPSMNSFNHYAYGAVGSWMFRNVGGIAPLEPGYKKISIAPLVGGGLTHARGTFDSVYGTIVSDWSTTAGGLTLHVEVPVNTTAEVRIPASSPAAVMEGTAPAATAQGVVSATASDGDVILTVGSGTYDFSTTAETLQAGELVAQTEALGAYVTSLDAASISAADKQSLTARLASVRATVQDAADATIGGDRTAAAHHLSDALAQLTEARAWVGTSAIPASTAADVGRRMDALAAQLSRVLSTALQVSVSLPSLAQEVLPGTRVTGAITLRNDGDAAVSSIRGTVEVPGVGTVPVALAGVPAGGSAQLPFTLTVPRRTTPGAKEARFALTYVRAGATVAYQDVNPAWVTVTSGLAIGDVGFEPAGTDPVEHAVLDVTLSNAGSSDAHGVRVTAALPAGWTSVASAPVTVPASGTVVAKVPVVVPISRTGQDVPLTVTALVTDTVLATTSLTGTLGLPVPDGGAVVDHVDFGTGASESAHQVQASPSSGTNEEAGLSRRYTTTDKGQWFSAQVAVPEGEPFVLRTRETFGGSGNKLVQMAIDDTPLDLQIVSHKGSGAGAEIHDVLVDDPALIDGNGGTVRVTYSIPDDSTGYSDPSVADLWVMGLAEDTLAPAVSAYVKAGLTGDEGWFRSPSQVAVEAVDSRDPAPGVQVDVGSGWADYAGPVQVSGDGKHTVSFRATDASGNTSQGTLPVWIDSAPPVTTAAVTRQAPQPDRATVVLSARDELSGVASTQVRVDGGAWTEATGAVTVSGLGSHTVEYASTDVAGNAEAVRSTTVDLVKTEALTAIVAPQLRGTAVLGGRLTTTPGSWNMTGLTFRYQWTRDGKPVAGRTGTAYALGKKDVGHRIAVKVTAARSGLAPVTAVSSATAAVRKATAKVTVRASKAKVTKGKKVTLKVRVKSPTTKPTGKVRIFDGGKRLKTVKLWAKGVVKVTVKLKKKGKHKIRAVFRATPTVKKATSKKRVIKVR